MGWEKGCISLELRWWIISKELSLKLSRCRGKWTSNFQISWVLGFTSASFSTHHTVSTFLNSIQSFLILTGFTANIQSPFKFQTNPPHIFTVTYNLQAPLFFMVKKESQQQRTQLLFFPPVRKKKILVKFYVVYQKTSLKCMQSQFSFEQQNDMNSKLRILEKIHFVSWLPQSDQ